MATEPGGGDTYPIEIDFPDLAPYAASNCGIPFVYSFDSGVPGPHVMVTALTHGNEVCGAVIVKALLDLGVRPERGRLTLAFANVEAYLRFDPEDPDASRFVDQDLNRVWDSATLDDLTMTSIELTRARALRSVIDSVDLMLDLHSMHERSEPLCVAGPLDKTIEFARRLGIPSAIVSDKGHSEGCRLRDYGGFGDPGSPKNAMLVECGQHWERGAVDVARKCTARFLVQSGVLDESKLPPEWQCSPAGPSTLIRVTHAIVATSMNFRFSGPYTGLERFPDAGSVIAWQDDEPIVTPYPNCVLVMPSLRQLRPGVTVVRLGQIIDED